MAAPQWKGFLKLSLVSVPVKAHGVTPSEGGGIHLHQLHAECKSRIRYKKTCPIHGEVPNESIVLGYEYAKGQYVVVDTDEVDKLRTEDEKAIRIDAFVAPDAVDPIFLAGKSYFLLPDGKVLQRQFKQGDVIWSNSQTHIGTNTGDTPTHVILVETKSGIGDCAKK